MRNIDNIEIVMGRLQPHMERIEQFFNQENEKFKVLLAKDHDCIGHILKCHLILEQYMDQYLLHHFGLSDIDQIRLSFFQKTRLLPNTNPKIAFLKPGIFELNSIRNKYGHDLDAIIQPEQTRHIEAVLHIARQGMAFPNLDQKIEMFTTIAATFLIVDPKDIKEIFARAFEK